MQRNIHPSSIVARFRKKLDKLRNSMKEKQEDKDGAYAAQKWNSTLDEIEKILRKLESNLNALKSYSDDPMSSTYITHLYSSENLNKLELDEKFRRLMEKQLKDEDSLKQSIENAYFTYVNLLRYILSNKFLNDHTGSLDYPSDHPNELDIEIARREFILRNLSMLTPIVENTYESYKNPQDLSKLQKLVEVTKHANDKITEEKKEIKDYNKPSAMAWTMGIGATLGVIGVVLGIAGIALLLTGNPVGLPLLLTGFFLALPMFGVVGAGSALPGLSDDYDDIPRKSVSHKGFSSALDKANDVINVAKSTIRSTSHMFFTPSKTLEPTSADKTTTHNHKKKKP